MSYQVIARKYRPQRFSDVVGQDHVALTLSNAIRQNRIAHAYLFCGPRGTGKTTIARIFAKCLNCTDGPKVEFADNDPRCVEITEGRSLDVIEIDGASNRGIEEIRQLRDTVRYAPATSRFKIYIIDEVHMLTKEAFNALLKTLEEPPAHAKFMFATTEPEKVLPTILSRCQRFDLRRIPSALIVQHLAHIAKLESVRVDTLALHAIARGADGGMRDAESTLDQLISFCGDQIEENDVLAMFGLVAQQQILDLAHAILAARLPDALRLLEELARHGKDLGRLLAELLNHFRTLLLFHLAPSEISAADLSESETASLAEQANLADASAVSRIMETLIDYEWRLRDAPSKRILLEVALLKAIEARNAVPIDVVLQQLQSLRSPSNPAAPGPTAPRPAASKSMAPTSKPSAVSAPQPAPESSQNRELGSSHLDQLWQTLIDAVGRVSPFARSYFLEAHPVSFANQCLVIGFDSEFADHLELVDNVKNRTLLQTKLAELGHAKVEVKFIKAERPVSAAPALSPEPPSAPQPPPTTPPPRTAPQAPAPLPQTSGRLLDKNDLKSDPLIQKALEIFKAQIAEIRTG
jgi:DNA polymerase-3 subunit gamma/tau